MRAVSIDSQTNAETAVDYRAGGLQALLLKHDTHDLPADVAAKCVEMIEHYGLRFGAFDFVVTPECGYIFLELNPNCQWLWLQRLTNIDMVGALCQLLESGNAEAQFEINGRQICRT